MVQNTAVTVGQFELRLPGLPTGVAAVDPRNASSPLRALLGSEARMMNLPGHWGPGSIEGKGDERQRFTGCSDNR